MCIYIYISLSLSPTLPHINGIQWVYHGRPSCGKSEGQWKTWENDQKQSHNKSTSFACFCSAKENPFPWKSWNTSFVRCLVGLEMHAPTSDHSRARLQGPYSYSSATPDRLKESAGHHQAIHLFPQSKRHPLDLAGNRSSSEAYCKAQPRPGRVLNRNAIHDHPCQELWQEHYSAPSSANMFRLGFYYDLLRCLSRHSSEWQLPQQPQIKYPPVTRNKAKGNLSSLSSGLRLASHWSEFKLAYVAIKTCTFRMQELTIADLSSWDANSRASPWTCLSISQPRIIKAQPDWNDVETGSLDVTWEWHTAASTTSRSARISAAANLAATRWPLAHWLTHDQIQKNRKSVDWWPQNGFRWLEHVTWSNPLLECFGHSHVK